MARAAAVRGTETAGRDPGAFELGYRTVQSAFQMSVGRHHGKTFFYGPGGQIIHMPVELARGGSFQVTSKPLRKPSQSTARVNVHSGLKSNNPQPAHLQLSWSRQNEPEKVSAFQLITCDKARLAR